MKRKSPLLSAAAKKQPETLAYKLFWNWDHSTNWCLNTLGAQNCGVANHYTKKSGAFARDFTRAIDWCAANGIDGVGVVGLLRDSHGGIDAAKKICAYAREHGVRLYLIAGLYSYGGIYYEGDSPLSLDRFLSRHPECMAQALDATPHYIRFGHPHGYKRQAAGCPSNRKLRNFMLDALDYLFAAIPDLGGIQIESGDSMVCMCESCQARRREMQGGERRVSGFSFSDMADIYPAAADVVWSRSPDAWVICETYTHFLNNKVFGDLDSPATQAMLKMPEKTFWQWSDRHLKPDQWQETDRLPEHLRKFRHIMRAHHGTQWDGGRHTLAVEQIRQQCRLSFESGIQGVSIFGECSPFHTNTEFNYLALQYFADHPFASLGDFATDVMAARLGGAKALAETYLEFGILNKTPEKIPAAVKEIARIIPKVKDADALRRWCYLANFLNSFQWESVQRESEKSGARINLDILQ